MKKFILFLLLIGGIFLIHTNDVSAQSDLIGQVSTQGSNLNIRKTNSTSSSIVGTLSNGSYIEIVSTVGDFYQVRFDASSYGYVSKNYVKTISSSKYYTTTSLNVRTGPSTSYSVKTTLNKNTKVFSINTSQSFYKILYDGNKTGYVSKNYLTSTPSITLNVVNYKQFDSRWASVKIGNSTMKAIGCATTALSMTESYRTGTTITPAQMVNKLSYTSGGALYWPSNYTYSTSSSYLSLIYAKLQEGKPVILGAKSSTSSHFVVVTGFKGGSMTTSNFTINDPGSSYRTTLNELFSSYPTFYKIVYYK